MISDNVVQLLIQIKELEMSIESHPGLDHDYWGKYVSDMFDTVLDMVDIPRDNSNFCRDMFYHVFYAPTINKSPETVVSETLILITNTLSVIK